MSTCKTAPVSETCQYFNAKPVMHRLDHKTTLGLNYWNPGAIGKDPLPCEAWLHIMMVLGGKDVNSMMTSQIIVIKWKDQAAWKEDAQNMHFKVYWNTAELKQLSRFSLGHGWTHILPL